MIGKVHEIGQMCCSSRDETGSDSGIVPMTITCLMDHSRHCDDRFHRPVLCVVDSSPQPVTRVLLHKACCSDVLIFSLVDIECGSNS